MRTNNTSLRNEADVGEGLQIEDGDASFYTEQDRPQKCTACDWIALPWEPVLAGATLEAVHVYCSNCGAQDTLQPIKLVEA